MVGGIAIRSSLSITEKGIEVSARLHCPEHRVSTTLSFLLDTGSDKSFLSWEDPTRAGVDVDSLPSSTRPVSGFGGSADARQLKATCYLYVMFDNKHLETVELSAGLLIYRPSRKRASHWQLAPAISILGRDFLRESGWILVVDLAKKKAYLEKP